MQTETIGEIKIEIRGVGRTFTAYRIHSGGGDFGLPNKGYAYLQVATGYAGTHLPAASKADAKQAIRVLSCDFIDAMLSVKGDDDDS
jgi:hypothetical protein